MLPGLTVTLDKQNLEMVTYHFLLYNYIHWLPSLVLPRHEENVWCLRNNLLDNGTRYVDMLSRVTRAFHIIYVFTTKCVSDWEEQL